jgi:hypothetical protein
MEVQMARRQQRLILRPRRLRRAGAAGSLLALYVDSENDRSGMHRANRCQGRDPPIPTEKLKFTPYQPRNLSPETRVAIYGRTATVLQDAKPVAEQVDLCGAYAERHSWEVVATYADDGCSGMAFVGRQGFSSMMTAAENGEFSLLLTSDLDRLSRNAMDTHSIANELKDFGVQVCTVAAGMVDLETAASERIFTNSRGVSVRRSLRTDTKRRTCK